MIQLLKLQQFLIQRRRGATKKEISALLKKSVRQVERYLKQLAEAGVPLVIEGAENSGVARRWRIDREGFFGLPQETPPISLNQNELFVVAAAIESAQLPHCSWLDRSRESVLEKLSLYLPGQLSRRLPVLKAGLADIGPNEAAMENISQNVFEAITEGLIRNRRVEINYPWSIDFKGKRKIEPLGLLLAHGSLYCAVHICPHEDVRYLKFERIKTAKTLDEEFAPAKDFDLKEHLASNFSLWNEDPEKVEIRFSADVAEAIRLRQIHPSQEIEELPDGGLILKLQVGGKWELIWWLLKWGDAAELLKPKEWRKELAAISMSMYRMYK